MQQIEQNAFGPLEIAARNGIGKTKVYAEIDAGRLKARKLGRRTLITIEDERRWLDALAPARPQAA